MNPHSPTSLEAINSKVMRRLLPFLLLMYVLAFLDRANIGFAQKALQHDTGLSNAAFAFGAGVFFVGYALFEVPSNLLLHKVGARAWMCRIMVTWGLVSAAMCLRAYADGVLLTAFSARRRRSRFLSRRDLLPDPLVSAIGARARGGRVLFRRAAGVHLRQSAVGFVARIAWRAWVWPAGSGCS